MCPLCNHILTFNLFTSPLVTKWIEYPPVKRLIGGSIPHKDLKIGNSKMSIDWLARCHCNNRHAVSYDSCVVHWCPNSTVIIEMTPRCRIATLNHINSIYYTIFLLIYILLSVYFRVLPRVWYQAMKQTMHGCVTTSTVSWQYGGWPWHIGKLRIWMKTEPKLMN